MHITMRDQVLLEGLDDYVSASCVYSLAIDTGLTEDSDRRALAVGTNAELICTGLAVAGGLSPGGFAAWERSAAESIRYIANRWVLHGNPEPITDEIVWLALTEEGRRVGVAVSGH